VIRVALPAHDTRHATQMCRRGTLIRCAGAGTPQTNTRAFDERKRENCRFACFHTRERNHHAGRHGSLVLLFPVPFLRHEVRVLRVARRVFRAAIRRNLGIGQGGGVRGAWKRANGPRVSANTCNRSAHSQSCIRMCWKGRRARMVITEARASRNVMVIKGGRVVRVLASIRQRRGAIDQAIRGMVILIAAILSVIL
jgi:hypothetical protein